MVLDTQIPKIIHQLWIGSRPAPTKFMDTWREAHEPLGFKYMFWNEKNISQNIQLGEVVQKLNSIEEINGKADVIRWLILQKFGGVFVDADSICIHPFDEHILNGVDAFAGWEQEQVRKGLAATGTMGFTPYHPIVNSAIEWIKRNPISQKQSRQRAWFTVGPGLLTRICEMYGWNNIKIYPSYYFLPFHYTGIKYEGHEKVYAYQEWGSTKQNYEVMNSISLPTELKPPLVCCSVLVSSYNTNSDYMKQCLNSIKQQVGLFNIELVWVNDGSSRENTEILKQLLDNLSGTSRFLNVKLLENDGNKGIGYSLNRGVLECSYEIIIKMDSDDVMVPNRIQKQIEFMLNNPHCKICGGQVAMFRNNIVQKIVSTTNHPDISWDSYKSSPKEWFVNHPTLCYKRQAIIDSGNYDPAEHSMIEDFHLELKMLKTFGKIYNMPDVLLHYRLHPEQITHSAGDPKWKKIRSDIISEMIKD